jgi:hypothetical protein
MKRIAAPMVGGIFASFVLELLVYPAIYAAWRQWAVRRELRTGEEQSQGYAVPVGSERNDLVTLQLQ